MIQTSRRISRDVFGEEEGVADAAASVRETGGSRRLRGSICIVESRRPAARLRERAEAGVEAGRVVLRM